MTLYIYIYIYIVEAMTIFALTFVCITIGHSSGYQATSSSGVQAGVSDLPQLTGEDLKMLDTFDQIREGSQFYGSLPPQPQQPSATLNYRGNGVLM